MKSMIFTLLIVLLSTKAISENLVMVNEHSFVHLLCHSTISYVQAGDPQKLMAEPLNHYPNVLRFKALEPFEGKSSLTFICDGQLYCLEVVYNEKVNLNLDIRQFIGEPIKSVSSSSLPPDRVIDCMDEMLKVEKGRQFKHTSKDNVVFSMEGIGVAQDLMFVRLTIVNHSNIIYKTGIPVFLMQDKKPKKAANRQEYPVEPYKVSNEEFVILPGESQTIVMVFYAFTIPSHKIIRISLSEESENYTGRDLELIIKNKAIKKAIPLKY
nr:DUF4138 domain-containing protein [uncultured Carboxylicivirga sp.]